ncbi:hypothetical protein GIB67_036505, partial [Kingdonia uniflora]
MEDDSRVFANPRWSQSNQPLAGTISKITLENFMCHTSTTVELIEHVNFITGQNGSGKSAILTALCVAFGCRAKGTQRASTLKDFIKTGCSYASVYVEIKNQGEDAFKHDVYGDVIIIERKISASGGSNSTILKDCHGKKVASRRDDLRDLVEHFNIDVENPCVIMSQDKSREFLHSGNDRDKFKFFFKATLLQQVNDLLQETRGKIDDAKAQVVELVSSIRPILKELKELQGKIKSLEHVEENKQQIRQLSKKLAWSFVYDVDNEIQDQAAKIEKLKERIPTCQERINRLLSKLEELNERLTVKKTQIASMMEKTLEVRRMKDELQQNLSMATKERYELGEVHSRKNNLIQKLVKRVRSLEKQENDQQEQYLKNTQAEECEIEDKMKRLQDELDSVNFSLTRLKEEENALSEEISTAKSTITKISEEIEDHDRKFREIGFHVRKLQQHRTNKVTAFGGEKVIYLLREIERHHRRFKMAPIGPIGSHVTLINDDTWALAVENAIGNLLNAFIVTDHNDFHILRGCARDANYNQLQIFIYDFSRPQLNIPNHMLPHTNHPTLLSVIHSDNPTILNVLVDMGNAERQVLVNDYEMGKSVAFDQRVSNLKEVYTLEGCRMFSRGSVQTVLPPKKNLRGGRLCSSFDAQIENCEIEASRIQEAAKHIRGRKRNAEEALQDLEGKRQGVKRRCDHAERDLISRRLKLQDLKKSYAAGRGSHETSNVEELRQEISRLEAEIQEHQIFLEKYQVRITEAEAKANNLKSSFEDLCESAKGDIDAFEKAERELMLLEEGLRTAEAEKLHYEEVMRKKVLHDIKVAEELHQQLQIRRQEDCKKASIICSESELESLGGCVGSTTDQLRAQLDRLQQRLQQESQRLEESIEDLRAWYEKKERMIKKKQQNYEAFGEKLDMCEKALDLRWIKFQRTASLVKKELTWGFNGHLRKKGVSGLIKVSYEEKTLSVEVRNIFKFFFEK